MKLYFENDAFSLDKKTEFKDENGNVVLSGIYDFAYKGRIRILDSDNGELAYVQFKILESSDEVGFYDKKNIKLGYIKLVETLNDISIEPEGYKVKGDLENLSFDLVDNSGSVVMNVKNNVIDSSIESYKSVMYMYVLKNSSKLKE